jgi:hypothetical protein
MGELFTTRREMMAVPLFAAAFAMFRAESVKAAGVDPTMTMITPPDQISLAGALQFSQGRRRDRAHGRQGLGARPIFRADPLASRLHERAALV